MLTNNWGDVISVDRLIRLNGVSVNITGIIGKKFTGKFIERLFGWLDISTIHLQVNQGAGVGCFCLRLTRLYPLCWTSEMNDTIQS